MDGIRGGQWRGRQGQGSRRRAEPAGRARLRRGAKVEKKKRATRPFPPSKIMSSTEPSLFSRMLGTDDGPLTTSTKSADIRAPSSHQLAPPPAAPSTPHAETTARPPASVIAVPASAGTLKQSTGPRSPVSHPEMYGIGGGFEGPRGWDNGKGERERARGQTTRAGWPQRPASPFVFLQLGPIAPAHTRLVLTSLLSSPPCRCTSPSDIGIWEVSKLDTRESGPAGLFRAVFGGGSQKE